jgi:sec-independent protein translocase protein TatC
MTARPGEDLFEETRMTFGQHLEELRGTLVRCLIGISIGCLIGFLVADRVVTFLQTPLTAAIKKFHDDYALIDYQNELGYMPPEMQNRMQHDGLAPETVLVDPGQLVQAIRTISPGSLAEIDLTPYRFPANALNPAAAHYVANVLVHKSGSGPVQNRRVSAIASLLSPDDLETLRRIAMRDASSITVTDSAQVIRILNLLLDHRAIHDSAAFADLLRGPENGIWSWMVPVTPNQLQKMKAQVERHPGDAELSRRLNRLLVAATFPDQIAPPTIDLVRLEIWQSFSEGTQALSPHEVFMVWMKAALVTGLLISAPWVFYQLWLFVAAGLYPHEQKYVYIYLPISLSLFALGVCLAFFFVFQPVLQFLFSFNASMGIKPQLRIGEWLSFVLFLPLGFGVAFQLPLVMLFVQRIGLVTTELYVSQWKISIMIISVLSMLLTPADPVSMILLGVPLTFLYFFGIYLCRWMPAPHNPFGDNLPSRMQQA